MHELIDGFMCFQAAKICNNMLLAISMIGTAEAMNLGIRFVWWIEAFFPYLQFLCIMVDFC